MNRVVDDLIEETREERWDRLVEINGFRCRICGAFPPFAERDAFFDTGLCGFHAHVARGGEAQVDDLDALPRRPRGSGRSRR
jgi:hypothetical protein